MSKCEQNMHKVLISDSMDEIAEKILKSHNIEVDVITNYSSNELLNNISKYKNFIFFLNSYGTLYSIDSETMDLKWFINLNPSLIKMSVDWFPGKII